MSPQPVPKDLDPSPLVAALVEKTSAGKLSWESTAAANTFIASIAGDATLKIAMEDAIDINEFGNPETYQRPVLSLMDPKGKTLWEIHSGDLKGGLWPLFKLAQRIGNKLDERMAALIEVLQRL